MSDKLESSIYTSRQEVQGRSREPIMHTTFISSPECLARLIPGRMGTVEQSPQFHPFIHHEPYDCRDYPPKKWHRQHPLIPVSANNMLISGNPCESTPVGISKVLGPSTDSNPGVSGGRTANSWTTVRDISLTARPSPPFPRDILGILGRYRSSAQQLGLRQLEPFMDSR